MAARSWATSISTAIGVAAGAGAAQLGLGYGLGIISWQSPGSNATVWVSSLVWVAWLSASSTVIGALCADRLSAFSAPVQAGSESIGARAVTAAWRVVIALCAAIGALITVPLVAVPARAPRPDNVAPYFTAGGYAVAGIIVGLVVAAAVLVARPIAANIVATTAWLWTLAGVAVFDTVRAGGELAGTAQLATWQFADPVWVRLVNLPGALLTLTAALLIGFLAAWPAGRRGENRVGVAVSGAFGPLLVAVAYLLGTPGPGERDLSAFVIAPYAMLAGLAGSVIVSAIGPKGARTAARAERRVHQEQRDARAAAEYADWAQALAAAEATGADHDRQPAPVAVGATGGEDSTVDLDADGYTPSRAYDTDSTSTSDTAARAYAEDSVEAEPATSAATATGRASVKEPLWPNAEPATPPVKPKRGRGRSATNQDDA